MAERQVADTGSVERIAAGRGSSPLLRASLLLAALGFTACAITVLAARLEPVGHPPLSFYVGSVAIPIAWALALGGIALAVAANRSAPVPRNRLALLGNVIVIVLGGLIWLLWPWLAA